MIKISNYFSKKMLIIAAIPLLIMIYFFDNIKGQYRFMQYCKTEGGLRVYEPLEKGVGWLAKDYSDAKAAAQLKHVGFVRFIGFKGDGKEYDLRYLGNNPQRDESFDKVLSDLSKPIIYEWKFINHRILNELRLSIWGFEIIDIEDQSIASRYHSFSYSQFDRSKSLFDAPSTVYCFRESGRVHQELNSSFVD